MKEKERERERKKERKKGKLGVENAVRRLAMGNEDHLD